MASRPMPKDMTREPCPDRILDDIGGGFAMGALGGSACYFIKGLYNSPKGHRLAGGATAARMKAGRLGGSFATWAGVYSTFDCGLVHARQKEDPWNSIAAGGATGGFLAMRHGLVATGRSALMGAAFLMLVEGAGIMINRVLVTPMGDMGQFPGRQDTVQPVPGFLGVSPAPPMVVEELTVPEPAPATGWFGGFFGKKDQVARGDRSKSEKLDMDSPSPAVPSFEFK